MSADLVNAFFLQLLTGLQLGSIYMLVALGLTLIFGTLGVVNFAHGALFMLGAYLGVVIAGEVGFLWAILLVPLSLFVIGLALERGIVRHFYDRPHTDQILVTFGIAIVVQEILRWIFGANNIPFQVPKWGSGIVRLHEYLPFLEGFVAYPKWRLILVVVSLVTVGGLFLLLQFTRFGLVVRAGMRDAQILRFLGINIERRFALVFGLGAAIASIAGLFGGPVTQVFPGLGMAYLVPSFLVVVIGGMGSVAGAVIAALLLGMALAFSAEYSAIQQIIIYVIAVVVLLVRPRGLMGKKGVLE
jgi:branched-chain amino acid transport system permease protein